MGSTCASSVSKKAWFDEQIMLDWIFQQWNNCFINLSTNGSSGKILIADVHRAQQTVKVKCILKKKMYKSSSAIRFCF